MTSALESSAISHAIGAHSTQTTERKTSCPWNEALGSCRYITPVMASRSGSSPRRIKVRPRYCLPPTTKRRGLPLGVLRPIPAGRIMPNRYSNEDDKQYEGRREGYAVIVPVDGRRLNPRHDLWNHSPTGFEWGYGGSGPAPLALAILADHLGNDRQAFDFHHRFKWAVTAELPFRRWTLTSEEIDRVLHNLQELEPLLEGVT